MSSCNTVCAIIPARAGSKGVPGKNIRPLAGFPLIAYSIVAANLSKMVQRVIVSTDSEEIAEIARRFGAEVPFLRPAELAQDLSPDRDFVLHTLSWFAENEGSVPDYIVHVRPTTPLRDPERLDEAIDMMLATPSATSLRSAHEAPESPYKWFERDKEGFFRSFARDSKPGDANLPRQLFPSVYIPDGYVDVLRASFVLQSDDIHGDRMLGYVSPECCEVDSPDSFEYLEFQLSRKGSPLLDHLKNRYLETR